MKYAHPSQWIVPSIGDPVLLLPWRYNVMTVTSTGCFTKRVMVQLLYDDTVPSLTTTGWSQKFFGPDCNCGSNVMTITSTGCFTKGVMVQLLLWRHCDDLNHYRLIQTNFWPDCNCDSNVMTVTSADCFTYCFRVKLVLWRQRECRE
jgi:hypothetical protein